MGEIPDTACQQSSSTFPNVVHYIKQAKQVNYNHVPPSKTWVYHDGIHSQKVLTEVKWKPDAMYNTEG